MKCFRNGSKGKTQCWKHFFLFQSKIIWTRANYFGIFQIYRKPLETQGILFWVNETFLNLPLWILVTFTCLAEKFPACTISMVLDMKVEWRCFYYPSRGLHYSNRPVSEFSDWIVVSRVFLKYEWLYFVQKWAWSIQSYVSQVL